MFHAKVDQRTSLAGKNRFEMLVFKVNQQTFGINVFKVREIVRLTEVRRAPHMHPHLLGLASIRGEALPVINTHKAIGMGDSQSEQPMLIVTEFNQRALAFLVDSVQHTVTLDWNECEPPPTRYQQSGLLTAYANVEGSKVGILDVEKILSVIDGERRNRPKVDANQVQRDDKILVVDDSRIARRQVTRTVESLGFKAIEFANGKEALLHLQQLVADGLEVQQQYALMITDIEMPVMDGYTLTSKVKSTQELRELTVVMHSSLSGVFNTAMTQKVGADFFLAKFDAEALQDLIKEAFELSQSKLKAQFEVTTQ
ncbi:chemotaxis protein [Paraferrimonas sedimenticola]|uniref:Chemotaxis protein CheW n=1 Tax=Paraferrimonas sedimenticola TaxID=375674 RepID=A0AA37RVH8_9GAMM|nr:chemotaxis protein [Paraferrimonas sedimenticola]GLP95657.1 chemotaxis protein CheW [Paraferrimonas sedimenticola]